MNTLLEDASFQKTELFKEFKGKPLGFIDVGARGGLHTLVEPLAGITAVLGFEPDEAECERMRREVEKTSLWAKFELSASALAGQKGERKLHLFAHGVNDSLLSANKQFVERYNVKSLESKGEIKIQAESMDELLFEKYAKEDFWGELIKLDAQGADLEILKGMPRTLRERSVALLVEVEFCRIYENQPMFSEVELFLREQGFTFYGFEKMSFRSRQRGLSQTERLIWGDAVFFKDPFDGGGVNLSDRHKKALFCSAMLLKFYDFALELVDKLWEGEEKQLLEEFVRSIAKQ